MVLAKVSNFLSLISSNRNSYRTEGEKGEGEEGH